MEELRIVINQPNGEFDNVLKHELVLPDVGDIRIITKDNATTGGNAAVMVTFSVQLPDGSMRLVQTVTTMKLFRAAALAIAAVYDDEGKPIK